MTYFQSLFSPDKNFCRAIKNITGFYPSNIRLYKLALTHKSQAEKIIGEFYSSNERLEFLGDAVLGVVIADYLFKRHPFEDEGFLTQARSKIVNRSTLHKVAIEMGIDRLIAYDKGSAHEIRYILGNALEALIGAVYLDKSIKGARNFILNRMLIHYLDVDKALARETDFKSKLINWAQKEKKQVVFHVTKEIDMGSKKEFVVCVKLDNNFAGEGRGFSKKSAEQQAAEAACEKLKPLME